MRQRDLFFGAVAAAGLLATACTNTSLETTATQSPATTIVDTTTSTTSEAPESIALADDPLCQDIDAALDAAIAVDAWEFAALSERVNEQFADEIAEIGQAETESEVLDAIARVDAIAIDRCGLGFLQATMFVGLTCLTEDVFESDLGPCTDPRDNPDAVPSIEEMLQPVEELGAQVESNFEDIEAALNDAG